MKSVIQRSRGWGVFSRLRRDQREHILGPGFVQEAVIMTQGWHMRDM